MDKKDKGEREIENRRIRRFVRPRAYGTYPSCAKCGAVFGLG